MIKTIIFDYDGVIVDSFPSVHKTYLIICKQLGKKCPTDFEKFKEIYGYGSKELMNNLSIYGEEVDKANYIYRQEIIKTNSPIFEGIKEVIVKLSESYNLVLISSSPREEVMHKLEKYGLSKKFNLIFASDSGGAMRKVEAIQEAIKRLGADPKEVIMIGDRVVDFNEGVEAGLSENNIMIVDYGWGYDKDKVPKQKTLIKKPT